MKINGFMAILAGAAILGGCTQEARQKYDAAGDEAGAAAQKTTDAIATDASKTGQVIQQEAAKAGEAAKNATANTSEKAANAGDTFKIKSAIMAAHDIKTVNLNVDTVDNKVILKGTVPTAPQKQRAGAIAQQNANGRQVDNQLQVSG